MVAAKKPRKPPAKTASAAKTAVPKKTASKAKAAEPAPAAKVSLYAIGDEVSHPMFGQGVVMAIEAAKLTIEFADGVTKQIVDDYVKPRKT